MKTTLKETVKLAKKGVITHGFDTFDVSEELFRLTLPALEMASKYFSFARNFTYENMYDNIYEELTLFDIFRIPDVYRDEGEDESRYLYLQHIAFGFLEADSIPAVRTFLSLSVASFVRSFSNAEYKKLAEMSERYLKYSITPETGIREFLKTIKNVINTPWRVTYDIEEYRLKIMGSSDILDRLFLKTLLRKYEDHLLRKGYQS